MLSTMEDRVLEVCRLLKLREWKLITVESCTGGGLAYALTSLPGSSTWFEHGLVTYSNTAKEELTGVKTRTLAQFGAVSEETAREMAEGGLRNSEAQVSISITGIAGPDGGSKKKPVGLVWFAIAGINLDTQSYHAIFNGDRKKIREESIHFILEKLIQLLR